MQTVEIDVEKLVELAGNHGDAMDNLTEPEMWAYVELVIAGSEFVFALWLDAIEPNGVRFLCLKGQRRLLEDMDAGVRTRGYVSVVPCRDQESAAYLRRRLGDRLDF